MGSTPILNPSTPPLTTQQKVEQCIELLQGVPREELVGAFAAMAMRLTEGRFVVRSHGTGVSSALPGILPVDTVAALLFVKDKGTLTIERREQR